MKKNLYRVFSVLLIVAFLVSSIGYSFAVGPVAEYVAGTFFDVVAGELVSEGVGLAKDFIKDHIGYSAGAVCKSSSDGYHHCEKAEFGKGTGGVDDNGRYSLVKCKYCGESFKYYTSGGFGSGGGGGFGKSDLEQSYDAQVSELPAQSITSSGGLIWQPNLANLTSSGFSAYYVSGWHTLNFSELPFSCSVFEASFHSSGNGIRLTYYNCSFRSKPRFSFSSPLSGSYRCVDSLFYSASGLKSDGSRLSKSENYSITSFSHYNSGDHLTVSCPDSEIGYSGISVVSGVLDVYFPVYEIIPDTSIDTGSTGDTYNINSRPTSITGNYGIIGDNGQITKVEGNTIVNETNNSYYNPITNETSEITNWNYDYSTRTYSLTLNGGDTTTTTTGDTVTVTYGDENVTINETTINESGDTITNNYTIYYLVQGSGSGDPDPGPDVPGSCDHTWTETSRLEPTCTTPGKVTSTCSKCSQTKTETIPANGHSWVVDRTVQTEYDEEGNLLQQGYTIYSCSVCGEQYKDMEGTGPPGGSGGDGDKSIWEQIGDLIGTIAGGFLGLIEAVLGKLLDALVSLAGMLMDKLKTVVETVLSIMDELPALFGGFLDFLTAMFPFLPPEIMTLLTFGIAAVVFIGIIKAIRR